MSNSLSSRVARVIAGGAHALVDKIEDISPGVVLEQSTRELEAITDEVRTELGKAIANRYLIQQQHLRLNAEHEELSDAIKKALDTNRDDLARHGVARQIDIEAQLPVLESSLGEYATQEKELTNYVDALMGKKREMIASIKELEEARQAALLMRQGEPSLGSRLQLKVDSVHATFDRTYQRQSNLAARLPGATVAHAAKLKELGDLTRDSKISERLALLKAS
jgi:phage shock protein A